MTRLLPRLEGGERIALRLRAVRWGGCGCHFRKRHRSLTPSDCCGVCRINVGAGAKRREANVTARVMTTSRLLVGPQRSANPLLLRWCALWVAVLGKRRKRWWWTRGWRRSSERRQALCSRWRSSRRQRWQARRRCAAMQPGRHRGAGALPARAGVTTPGKTMSRGPMWQRETLLLSSRQHFGSIEIFRRRVRGHFRNTLDEDCAPRKARRVLGVIVSQAPGSGASARRSRRCRAMRAGMETCHGRAAAHHAAVGVPGTPTRNQRSCAPRSVSTMSAPHLETFVELESC